MHIMSLPNHYQTLSVSEDASESEIKKAYRGLSLKYHPDKNSSAEAQTKMHEINDAYSVLGDKEKRTQYDNQRKFQGHGGHQMPNINKEFGDINDSFQNFFNQGGMPGQPMGNFQNNVRIFRNGQPVNIKKRPNNIIKTLHISLEQSYQGMNAPIDIERIVTKNNEKTVDTETIYVEVPPGIDANERILLKGKGHVLDELVSDVVLTVQLQKHEMFERRGMDLVCKREITLKESLCGACIEIQHVNGKKLTLNTKNNPYIITPGYRHTAREYGMIRNNIHGNMYIEFAIKFPSNINDEQRELLEKAL